MKKVAILQSNYIPWKGYFDIIAAVDEFILFDEMQYTVNDWRNRNRIKTPNGLQWLTVPVLTKGRYGQKISEAEIKSSANWAKDHWKAICLNYSRAPYFKFVSERLEPYYNTADHSHVSQLNRKLIDFACEALSITTKITDSRDYVLAEGKTERIVDLCLQAGANEYISGPAAKSYLDEQLFEQRGIKLTWFDYNDYPEYPQLWGTFEHSVSIIDLLFNCGHDARRYLKHTR